MGKMYLGMRIRGEGHVRVSESNGPSIKLEPRADLMHYYAETFEWGEHTLGSCQLALAILADAYGDDTTALLWHVDYSYEVLQRCTGDEFQMSQAAACEWLLGKLEGLIRTRRI